jgi:uncharacterized membrane protein HdeD (DUF308 family)
MIDKVQVGAMTVPNQSSAAPRSGWELVLSGLLAFAFGIAAVYFPANIMFGRIIDVIFGDAKPLSGGMTAVAALLALVVLVAVDGLINLFGEGLIDKNVARIRGTAGIAVAIAAVFWPGITAFVAVELIGLWAVLVGILELAFVRDSAKDRALQIIAAVALILIGVGMMRWVFAGAVVVSAVVGVAAAARGVSLILSGIHERTDLAVRRNG